MKRTELEPGKPLKKTAFRKKAKRKKKSTLARNKDKMDSSYWDKKCKAAVKEWAHMSPCMYCGIMEPHLPENHYIAGHHLLRRSRSKMYRWHPMNLIPLCPEHHTDGIQVCAHSDNPIAVVRFIEWLRGIAPQHYDWLVDHQDAIRKKDMRVGLIEHPDWRAQYTLWVKRIAAIEMENQDGGKEVLQQKSGPYRNSGENQ